MGLSNDPDKRARQLANLKAGREKAARSLLGDADGGDGGEPRSTEPRQSRGSAVATGSYGPGDSTESSAEKPRNDGSTEQPGSAESSAESRGAWASFWEGFTDG